MGSPGSGQLVRPVRISSQGDDSTGTIVNGRRVSLGSEQLCAEVLDWVKITDSVMGDTRLGNLGYIHRKLNFSKNQSEMDSASAVGLVDRQ